jgi:hypothetical protein
LEHKVQFFIIVLNIFLPKVGIEGGSKTEIYFLFDPIEIVEIVQEYPKVIKSARMHII